MNQSTIKTSRLTLRPFTKADSVDVQRLVGNVNVSKSTLNIPHPYATREAEEWIACHKLQWYQQIAVTYAIVYSATAELLGAISLMDIARGEASLGYWIGEPFWNHGFCTEASTAVIRHAFKEMAIEKLLANHVSNNLSSGSVMRKVGMRHTGYTHVKRLNGSQVRLEQYELQRGRYC